MIGIYMYENKLNQKKYIGQSTNIERRKEEHLKWPSQYSRFDNELKSIGENGFIFSIIEECKIELLDERETYWIRYYDSVNTGYNLTYGGQSYRGESNPAAKLTDDDVREIIDKLRDTKISIQQLASDYNVHYNTISNINRCKTWTHLHNYQSNIRKEFQGSLSQGELGTNKITEQQALYIIELLKNDSRSLAQISKDENLSLNIIYDINRCRTWKYLHDFKEILEMNLERQVM